MLEQATTYKAQGVAAGIKICNWQPGGQSQDVQEGGIQALRDQGYEIIPGSFGSGIGEDGKLIAWVMLSRDYSED
jgi:hypothetical protein